MMTRPEWALLANLSQKNGTLPHGNTNYGKYHTDESEKGERSDDTSSVTLTGSGPATWTHDHTPEGVHDLCGNVWEWVRGLRLKDGKLQRAKDNDSALDQDFTLEGDAWVDVLDNGGSPIYIVADDRSLRITSDHSKADDNCNGYRWGEVEVDCKSEQLKELALYAGEPESYIWADNEGEYLPICGGYWSNGSNAGVFGVDLNSPRSVAYSSIGFRSAFCKLKTDN